MGKIARANLDLQGRKARREGREWRPGKRNGERLQETEKRPAVRIHLQRGISAQNTGPPLPGPGGRQTPPPPPSGKKIRDLISIVDDKKSIVSKRGLPSSETETPAEKKPPAKRAFVDGATCPASQPQQLWKSGPTQGIPSTPSLRGLFVGLGNIPSHTDFTVVNPQVETAVRIAANPGLVHD